MSDQPFRFKQFAVAQDKCAMKIGTDGVLLGALAEKEEAQTILDIGCGTGLIALMLAQRIPGAKIDALDSDEQAAQQAGENFRRSPWSDRLTLYPASFEQFSSDPSRHGCYDLIVTNPPYFSGSLRSPDKKRNKARHAHQELIAEWIAKAALLLKNTGSLYFIIPSEKALTIENMLDKAGLDLHTEIAVHSFEHSDVLRYIIRADKIFAPVRKHKFVIYKKPGVYTDQYIELLMPFILNF